MKAAIKNLDQAIRNLETAQLNAINADARAKKTNIILQMTAELILVGVVIVSAAYLF